MPSFKKITGNYCQVVDALKLPGAFYNRQLRAKYESDVTKDLNRFKYINFNGDVAAMKQRFLDTSHLKKDEVAYTQGNFYGSVFTETVVKTNLLYQTGVVSAVESKTSDGYQETLGFSYVDDKGDACGLSITYLRDDSKDVHVNERPLLFNIAVIKGVNKAPLEREVTYFTHNKLLPNDAVGAEDLEAGRLVTELKKVTNCQAVNQLLTGIIKKETIALAPFRELNKRLVCGLNIDNRDKKLEIICDLFVMWAQLVADQNQSKKNNRVIQELAQIMENAYQDVNYFRDKTLQDVQNMVGSYQKNLSLPSLSHLDSVKRSLMQVAQDYQVKVTAAKAQLHKELDQLASKHGYSDATKIKSNISQSFLKRHLGNLLVVGIALLAVIGLVLTLTGVFAPIGLTLSAGLATALSILGVCTAGLAAERTVNMISHERLINTGKDIVKSSNQTVESHTNEYKEKLFNIIQPPIEKEPPVLSSESPDLKN
jgi:hypothetical protein